MRDQILSSTLKFYARFGVIIILTIVIQAQVSAQSPQSSARPDRGTASNGTYVVSDIERINLLNGNLSLNIPLAGLPQVAGGRLSAVITANYNSKTWDVKRDEVTTEGVPNLRYEKKLIQESDQGGWTINSGYALFPLGPELEDFGWLGPDEEDADYSVFQSQPYQGWAKYYLVTPDGARHELRPLDFNPFQLATRDFLWSYYWETPNRLQSQGNPNPQMRYYSYDGSFIWARVYPDSNAVKWEIYLPDGTQIVQRGSFQRIWDSNGNKIKIITELDQNNLPTVTRFQDENAEVIDPGKLREITYNRNFQINIDQVKYRTFGEDSWATIDLEWKTTTVWRKTITMKDHTFGTNNICDRVALFTIPMRVLHKIKLPTSDGLARREFRFDYNGESLDTTATVSYQPTCQSGFVTIPDKPSKGWGSLSKMTTPTGAEVFYTYNNDNEHFLLESDETAREKIQTKEIRLNSVSVGLWSYFNQSATGSVVGPDGSRNDEFAYSTDPGYAAVYGGPNGLGGLTFKSVRYLNNLPHITVERHYSKLKFNGGEDVQPGSLFSAVFNAVVDTEYTTLHDQAGAPQKMSAKKFTYDYNGNITEEKCYDWFDPNDVVRDANNVNLPTGVPATAPLLRTTTSSYYNQADGVNSSFVYAKQSVSATTPKILNALQETIVGTSRTRYSYDATTYPAPPSNGNLRKMSVWDSHNSKWIDTTYEYDVWGNRKKMTAPSGDTSGTTTTLMTFDTATHAQPVEVRIGPDGSVWQQISSTTYDYYTGLVTSQTDVNGKTTNIDYTNQLTNSIDVFGRPGFVLSPAVTSFYDGTTSNNQRRKVVSRYFDTARQLESISDLRSEGDGLLKSRTTTDQLGRTTLFESSENGSSYTISAQTIYVQMGRITKTANLKRNGAATTDGWTRTSLDDLGRVVEVTTFEGTALPHDTNYSNSTGKVLTSYDLHQTTVTDEAGKARKSQVDGLGRLIKVFEDPSGANFETNYTYDALGNLIQVNQGSQQRLFTYDSLSRLRTAKNPEQANLSNQQVATTYSYDDASNLTRRDNPNGSFLSFAYDGLNRARTKTLSSGGVWNYNYDSGVSHAKGRLVSVVRQGTSDGNYYDGYDAGGRLQTYRQVTTVGAQSFSYTTSYAYDLAGNLTSETYPSGREYRTSYDNAGRVASVSRYLNSSFDKSYATGFLYTAHGAIASMNLGGSIANPVMQETKLYNSRLQPTKIELKKLTDNSLLLGLDYLYGAFSQNNGNLSSQTIRIGASTSIVQNYTYDALNRLNTAIENGTWSQTFDYDRFGNRAVRVGSSIPTPALTPTSAFAGDLSAFNADTNRLGVSGYSYDISGNLTADPTTGANALVYDAENRQTSYTKNSLTTTFSYDAEGRRVKKVEPGNLTTVFVYNAIGQMIAEYKSDPVPAPEAGGGTSYLTMDALGSTRVVTGGNGEVKSRRDYLPFGEEISAAIMWGVRNSIAGYGVTDGQRNRFTSKEHDDESGLDFFLARYYSSSQGRFTSVDPLPSSAHSTNPQTWNRYSYVLNRVTVAIDPDGLATILIFVSPRAKGGSGRSTTAIYDKNGRYVRSKGGDGDARYETMSMAYDRSSQRPNKKNFDRTQREADTPFGVYTINRIEGGGDKDRLGKPYGTGKIVLDAVEGEATVKGRTGIAIHGGGSMLSDPYKPEQELKGTAGCTRCQNADINELIDLIRVLSQNGDKVTHVFIGNAEYIDRLAKEKNKDGTYKYPDLRIVQGYNQPPEQR